MPSLVMLNNSVMMNYMKLIHVGFAVDDLEESIALWEGLGFRLSRRFDKPEPKAKVATMKDSDGGGLELWEFENANDDMAKIIGRHFAFKSDNVRSDAGKLMTAGFEEVIPFTEGVVLDYIFLKDKFGAYYELAQDKDKQ